MTPKEDELFLKQSEFEKEIYMICSFSKILATAELAKHLVDVIPKPFGVSICEHDDWIRQAAKNKEEYISYFFKKWGPKDDS